MGSYFRKKYNKVLFADMAVEADKAWVCNILRGAIIELDLREGTNIELKLADVLPEGTRYGFFSYCGIAKYEDKLILAPRNGDGILIYDISNKKITNTIDVDVSCFEGEEDLFNIFSNVFIYEKKAYIVPGRYPGIIELDLDRYTIRVINIGLEHLKNRVPNSKSVIAARSQLYHGDIYLPLWQGNAILRYSIAKDKCDLIETGITETGISDIHIHDQGKTIYIANRDNRIIYRYENGRIVDKILAEPEGFLGEQGFKYLCGLGNELLAFPIKANMIVKFDVTSGLINCSKRIASEVNEKMKEAMYVDNAMNYAGQIDENRVVACYVYEGKLLIYDIKEKTWSESDLVLDDLDVVKLKDVIPEINRYNQSLFFENTETDLNDWIKYFVMR